MSRTTRNLQSRPMPLIWYGSESELQPFFFRGSEQGELLRANILTTVKNISYSEDTQATQSGELIRCLIRDIVVEYDGQTDKGTEQGELTIALITTIVKELSLSNTGNATQTGILLNATIATVGINLPSTSYDIDKSTLNGQLLRAIIL